MTTAADLIERTRRPLLSGQEETMNRLNGPITNVATTLALKYEAKNIGAGTIIAVDLEELRVWEWEPATLTATVVERAVNGTVAAAHNDLATVVAKPKFSNFRILAAINDDLNDLSTPLNGLFWPKTISFTYAAGTVGYDLAGVGNEQDILTVKHSIPGSATNDWLSVNSSEWRVGVDQDTSIFPSGKAIFFDRGGYVNAAYRVTYRAPYGQLATLADDVQTVTGLPATANDLPPMGAMLALVAPREIKRSFTEAQGDTRRAEEVPPGTTAGSLAAIRLRRAQRIGAEASRLNRLYPAELRTG